MSLTDEQRAKKEKQLAQLEDAMFQGVKSVNYGDRSVEFNSIQQMSKARRMLRQQLGYETRPQKRVAVFTRGVHE